jgi:hypothetical protein
MNPTHNQLEEAKSYVNLGIKEGFFNEEDWENLTDKEFVTKARYEMDKGDVYADAMFATQREE